MTYQVIARKWRPQSFDEVTGQEHITRTLKNAVEHERLHHAYLFSGARGVGKTTTARLLAKAVNCNKSPKPTATPCRTDDPDACASCREITESRSMDVREIDAASNTGVDSVREVIIDRIGVGAAKWEGRERYRVFIIDEVHMLSGSAFNALLKTLEEPPARVLFIMATTHPHKVPETILSRSQQFEFRTIPASKIAERLRIIADAEKIDVTDEALREVARAGEGSMRDAQSAFDQVISFSEGKIGAQDVEAALGLASSELLSRVTRAVAEQKPSDVLAVVADLNARGHELRNFCRDLLAHLRDLLVVKVSGDAALGDAADSERRALAEEARDFTESDLVRFFHSLTETEKNLREGAHPRYQLEIGLVKLVEMRRLAPLGRIVERLGALEEALRTGGAPTGGAGNPPAAPPASGAPPRRGVGSGGGASSFSPPESSAQPATDSSSRPSQPQPPTNGHAPNVEARAQAHASTETRTQAQAETRTQTQTETRTQAQAGASSALKLVPPPTTQSQGGAPSFTRDAASRAADAPFALADGEGAGANFFDSPTQAAPRQGEDRAGPPVSLVNAKAADGAEAYSRAADDYDNAPGVYAEAGDLASRVRRGLEGRGKPLLAVALEGARRLAAEGEEVRVEFPPESKHLCDALKKPEGMKLLREVCCEVLGRQVGVSVQVREAGEGDEGPAPEDEARREQRLKRERAEGVPAVQHMVKTFWHAEIIEVSDYKPGPQQ
jgi:DNA polymerase III subunit gamma/tau